MTTTSTQQGQRRQGFENSEGLRTLLTRLHAQGRGAWRADPEVTALMRHAAEKYAALAKKHGLDPWEAVSAAFDAMRAPSVRKADDPWAMVTRAVQVTCIAEERANGLLCSVHQARRPRFSVFHDAERFSDRENPLTDYHETFRITPFDDDDEEQADGFDGITSVESAVEDAIDLFTLMGWSSTSARGGVEYICSRLTDSASRQSAFEALRRDYPARALLDLPSASWLGMLRIVLGNPDPDLAHTDAGRGVLLRLLIGESLPALLNDDALLAEIVMVTPEHPSRWGRG
ncbi:hypothetical protein [Glaciibacter superstes]|uniref:hypothetical protein n=1 Tax=Glaciibacter superstes TaxID=501023 RepID=UPI0003B3C11B|nr:hypothetical protein [Glaciibacter superstes]